MERQRVRLRDRDIGRNGAIDTVKRLRLGDRDTETEIQRD